MCSSIFHWMGHTNRSEHAPVNEQTTSTAQDKRRKEHGQTEDKVGVKGPVVDSYTIPSQSLIQSWVQSWMPIRIKSNHGPNRGSNHRSCVVLCPSVWVDGQATHKTRRNSEQTLKKRRDPNPYGRLAFLDECTRGLARPRPRTRMVATEGPGRKRQEQQVAHGTPGTRMREKGAAGRRRGR